MPAKPVSRRQFLSLPETLCLSCALSWPHLCPFWRLKSAERGLELAGASAVKWIAYIGSLEKRHEYPVYKVYECRSFTKKEMAAL